MPNSTGTHQIKYDYCYDVPLLTSLQLLLRNKEIQKQVRTYTTYAMYVNIMMV